MIRLEHLVAMAFALLAGVAAAGWVPMALTRASDAGRIAPWTIVVTSLAFVAGMYMVARWAMRVALRPFRNLNRAMTEASYQPRDQIRLLRSRLQATPSSTVSEATEVRRALEAVLSRIEQRHTQQTAWIGAIVHDLKTPLAACANTLDVIASGNVQAPGGASTSALASRLAAELRLLIGQVQKMVDVVRFEREDLEIGREFVDLAAIARDVAEAQGTRRAFTLSVTGRGEVSGDSALLRRALENLIGNALRYARSSVSIEVYPGMVRVSDDGPGLPAPFEHLSQPFRSEPIDVGGATVAGGAAGIGLFVARRVFELHGGKLVVERSTAQGTSLLGYVESRSGA